MSDHLEARLRDALRSEADGLSVTITAAELERRHAIRRRTRSGQRMTVLAAGVAVVAIGTAVAIGGGWLRQPAVGITPTPTPSPEPTAAPSATPAASGPAPTVDPARVPPDLGTGHDPVVVRSVDDAGRRLLIVTVMLAPERNLDVAQFPIPDGSSLVDGQAQLGPTGFLAIPRSTEDEEPANPAIFVYDLATFADPPRRIEGGSGGFAWAPDGRLAVLDAQTIRIVDPVDWTVLAIFDIPAGVVVASDLAGHGVWAADGTGLLGGRVGVAGTDRGILGIDGSFTMDPAPAVFAPTGRERLFDGRGRELTLGCDGSAEGGAATGCRLTAVAGDGPPESMYEGDDAVDYLWTADGRSLWLVSGALATSGEGSIAHERLRRGSGESFDEIATFFADSAAMVPGRMIRGVSADDRVVALNGGLGPQDREAMTVVVDLETGDQWGLSGVFAGWASSTGPDAIYDPPPS